MADVWDEKAVFLAARALDPDAREAFLDSACKTPEQRARIETLIAQHEESESDSASKSTSGEPETAIWRDKHFDEFEIIHTLGAGGMGVVYLAEDSSLKRKVALKVLATHMTGSEAALARFRTEARTAASIKHPGVVPVYRFGFANGRHYLVSEYVEGPTLTNVIRDAREQREASHHSDEQRRWHKRCAEIVAQVADALDFSHREGIIHRDVKPSNIIVDPVAGPRLTDFGIAKYLSEEDRTQATSLVGSCHYMSPEQADIASTSIDQRSDVFSLGVVLYEMLTLRRPFDGDDPFRVLRAVVTEDPQRPRSIDPSIPRDLETICRKAMEKSRVNRYQSAAHFAADLRCFLEGRPILARPPSVGRVTFEFLRQRRRELVVAIVVLLVAAVGWSGFRMRALHNASLAWVSIDTGGVPATYYLQSHATQTWELIETPIRNGSASGADLGLQPGQYRLTLVRDSDDAFCEVNLVLTETGKPVETRVRAVDVAERSVDLSEKSVLLAVFIPNDDFDSEGMVHVEAGAYALAKPSPAHPVLQASSDMRGFYIDAQQVSNAEYREFVDATGYTQPSFWADEEYTEEFADRPVVFVSQADAEAYARWRGKRLPTLLERHAAARGRDGWIYPWGDDPRPDEVAWTYVPAATPILEMMASYREHVVPTSQPAPWDSSDGLLHSYSNVRDMTATVNMETRDVYFSGRAWSDDPTVRTLALITTGPMMRATSRTGFRCARSAAPPKGDH